MHQSHVSYFCSLILFTHIGSPIWGNNMRELAKDENLGGRWCGEGMGGGGTAVLSSEDENWCNSIQIKHVC